MSPLTHCIIYIPNTCNWLVDYSKTKAILLTSVPIQLRSRFLLKMEERLRIALTAEAPFFLFQSTGFAVAETCPSLISTVCFIVLSQTVWSLSIIKHQKMMLTSCETHKVTQSFQLGLNKKRFLEFMFRCSQALKPFESSLKHNEDSCFCVFALLDFLWFS